MMQKYEEKRKYRWFFVVFFVSLQHIMKHLHPLSSDCPRPERFTYPFCYEPHPLCQQAAKEVQTYIGSHGDILDDANRGKMFGVLVVEHEDSLGFLAAYSGLLAGRNDWEYFVPPVYDAQQPDGHFKTTEQKISQITSTTRATSIAKEMSQELQTWLFHQYQLLNARGETKDLVDIWQAYYDRPKLRQKYPLPPGGTGDCCAPKLLQYAYQQGTHFSLLSGFFGNQPRSTRLRCLNSSRMDHRLEKATTPRTVEGMTAFTASEPAMQPRATTRKTHQQRVPK